jgi:PAS domain-containing protein
LREARERTERKRAEEALRRSEKELRDLIGTIPAMAFVTRADGSNEFVSRQWIDFSGLSGEQSRGSGWAATLHPEDREQHLAKWQAAQASGQPFESEAAIAMHVEITAGCSCGPSHCEANKATA